ncbi:MAG TPA: MFS transporter [Gemmataceae bacterium]|nr:MFS transporter [Gemmataceae bacterium]
MTAAEPGKLRRELVVAVVASTIGTTIEWHDFFLYGFAATLVFPRLFFSEFDPFLAQILSYATFCAGFIARPVGGVVFGYIGDRVGRKSTLVATLLLMGLSTVLIGLVPTYAQVGPTAPLLLTALRFVQGLGVGGEWGGAVLLALEYGHRGRRGFLASWPQAGVPLGLLASTGVLALFQTILSEEDFLAWGWRVPFYLSGLLIVVGLVIRARLAETPLFARVQQENRVAHAPLRETLRRHWRDVLLAAGCRLTENSCFYLFTVYVLDYGRQVLEVGQGVFLLAVNLAAAVEVFAIPVYGLLSDRTSRKGAYAAGCLFLLAFAWPYWALLQTREPIWIIVATLAAMTGGHAVLYSVQASLIPELFGTRLRYTGASLGYQLVTPVGGLAPMIGAALVHAFPGRTWPLALYVALISAVSLTCVLLLAETSRKDISTAD